MLIGYLRGKADDAGTLVAYRQALQAAGCERVVEDLATAGGWGQPELRALLDGLRAGDVVVVPQLDCLGAALADVVRRIGRIAAASAVLRSIKEAIDTATDAGRAAALMVSSLSALDRGTRQERIGAGFAAARAQGRRGGRRPKLTGQQRLLIAEEVLSGRSTSARMARIYKVSAPTISRITAEHRARTEQPGEGRSAAAGHGQDERIAGVLPLSALDERLAIVGTSGSGKTYAAKGLVERLMDRGSRVCIVDPLGVWWGLRAGTDGSSPYPVVVFGGAHADVPFDPGMGAALGRLVATHPLACVADVSDLDGSAARRLFMTAFAEALYEANTEPLHLVLDEADLWAPQRAQPGGHTLLGRIKEIVRRGRVRGLVPWLITQRPAVLHKDVLSQADILVSMKLTASQDREAVGRWIEGQADRAEGRRILAALPRLGRGEGWVWSPADGVLDRVAFPRIRTFDSSRTPQRDKGITAPRTLAAMDLSVITAALARTEAHTAAEPDDTIAMSRRSLSELEWQLRQQEVELAAARARLAVMEAEAAATQAQAGCHQDEQRRR